MVSGRGVASALVVLVASCLCYAGLPTLLPSGGLGFGSQAVGYTSTAKTATLKNNLTTTLNITSIATSGDFTQTNNCGTSLAAGASCTINVTFTPIATGSRSGNLTVTHSASNSPQSILLNGTGVFGGKFEPQ